MNQLLHVVLVEPRWKFSHLAWFWLSLAVFKTSLIIFPNKAQANDQVTFPQPENVVPSVISQTPPLTDLQRPSAIPTVSPLPLSLKKPIELKIPTETSPDTSPTNSPTETSIDKNSDKITIQNIRFEHNTVFSQEELLKKVVKPLIGEFPSHVTFAQLLQVRSAVTQYYINKGYITSGAYIPEQNFQGGNGTVIITILEGSLDDDGIKVCEQKRSDNDWICRLKRDESDKHNPFANYVKNRLVIPKPLNKKTLLEALQILQLDPRIEKVSAYLLPGKQPGRNQLRVNVTKVKPSCTISPPCLRVHLATDNSSSPSVGSFRRQLRLNLLDVPKNAELDLTYSNTEGSNSLDLRYILSIKGDIDEENTNKNLIIRFNNTWNNVIEAPFNRLDINSISRYFDFTLQQSKYLTYNTEVVWNLGVSIQQSETSILGVSLPLSQDADDFGKTEVMAVRNAVEWTQRSRRALLSLRGELSVGANTARKQTFAILRGQGQWVKLLAPETVLLTRVNAQLASSSLPAFEQLALGGQDTVRGYRQNFLLADNGVNASLELQLPIVRISSIQGLVQIVPFTDFSTTWNNSREKSLDIPLLWSTGIGLQVRQGDFRARIDWGIPLVTVDSNGESLPKQDFNFSVSGVLTF